MTPREMRTYEAPRNPAHVLRVRGVGRVVDEPRALLVLLTERPTDDELRSVHDYLKDWSLNWQPFSGERIADYERIFGLTDDVKLFIERMQQKPVTEPLPLIHASTTA
jgi:hypothetical protein